MYAVHIIAFHNFPTDASNVLRRGWNARVHKPGIATAMAELGMFLWQSFRPEPPRQRRIADRKGHDPSVQFHAALMTFSERKGQRVVARTAPWRSRKGAIPRFDV